jgi:hypothetical protein
MLKIRLSAVCLILFFPDSLSTKMFIDPRNRLQVKLLEQLCIYKCAERVQFKSFDVVLR